VGGALPVSPLAPERFPDLPAIGGARFASAEAGVRHPGRVDVTLALLDPGTTVAGVFTRSSTRSAPVRDCEAKLRAGGAGGAAFLVNSGNSNAFTGQAGDASVSALCAAVARAAGVPEGRVFTASTGVIGERLPHDRIAAAVEGLVAGATSTGLEDAARAIMTTDTFPKGAVQIAETPQGPVTVAGIAKGSGMIAPDMATMLAFLYTDAACPFGALQRLTERAADASFNRVTVDGDTSTSDTVLVAATGASGIDVSESAPFAAALEAVMADLARQIVRDGEGATRFVEVRVTGAASAGDARRVARAIAESPLVKTAIAGQDPNWGRVVMAVGKSGAEADRDRLTIRFGDLLVAEKGWAAESYREEDGAAYMKNAELLIAVDLGLGTHESWMWTCDLTEQYIRINADYRS
jgi:glutamate N-acetyltransferase/amino-acid N-acetyltransferase